MAKSLPRVDLTETAENQSTTVSKTEVSIQATAASVHVTENYTYSLEHVRRLDVLLPQKHRKIMSDKIRHLQDIGAKLQDGTLVTDKTKALLWIIENEVKT